MPHTPALFVMSQNQAARHKIAAFRAVFPWLSDGSLGGGIIKTVNQLKNVIFPLVGLGVLPLGSL